MSSYSYEVGQTGAAEWPADGQFYQGTVAAQRQRKGHGNEYKIDFQDGDTAWVYSQHVGDMEKRAFTQESQPGPSAPNFDLCDNSDSESDSEIDLENENSDKQNSASAARDSSNLVMPPPKARQKKKELTTEPTFSAIEVGGVQIKVANVPLEVTMKLVNTTVERKESRSAWWGGELRRCLEIVSPDLVDVWDQMKWDTTEEKDSPPTRAPPRLPRGR